MRRNTALAATYSTVLPLSICSFNLEKEHRSFLDLFHKYNLMVIITFWMDSVLYPDLTNDKTIQLCLDNFRHTLRQNKGHPAVLMWAIGLEPNDPENPASFSEDLDMFFDFQEHIKNVRWAPAGNPWNSANPPCTSLRGPGLDVVLGVDRFDVWLWVRGVSWAVCCAGGMHFLAHGQRIDVAVGCCQVFWRFQS